MARDADAYEMTHRVFDMLAARGLTEADIEACAPIVRAVAGQSAEMFATFTGEDDDGPA